MFYRDYALNFRAFGTFSPFNILSAPTLLPLAGHPYFGPNALFHKLQEVPNIKMEARREVTMKGRIVFIKWICFYGLTYLKLVILSGKCNSPTILIQIPGCGTNRHNRRNCLQFCLFHP